jgi:hypothetical protein
MVTGLEGLNFSPESRVLSEGKLDELEIVGGFHPRTGIIFQYSDLDGFVDKKAACVRIHFFP